MERIAQIFDDLDDVFSTLGLAGERIRAVMILALIVLISLFLQAAGVVLALRHPPFALAMAMLMFTILLYRALASPHSPQRTARKAVDRRP